MRFSQSLLRKLQGQTRRSRLLPVDRKPTATPFLISTAESAPSGIAARVPVGSAPELSHKRTGPRLSCQACGTYPHGLNSPGNNLPIRHVPNPRSRDLGDMCALSGELRNELDLKLTGPPQIFAQFKKGLLSGD